MSDTITRSAGPTGYPSGTGTYQGFAVRRRFFGFFNQGGVGFSV